MGKPNVLLIMTDQQRWDTLGYTGLHRAHSLPDAQSGPAGAGGRRVRPLPHAGTHLLAGAGGAVHRALPARHRPSS